MINTGSDFSGVGAFDQALIRLGIDYKTVFACDMDKYARQTYCLNFGTPEYYPENVYDRAIPAESLDIYMSSPPCQAFSLAGKRQGEADKRGILFYNTHEFIAKNKPRYFIIENVKGLLSDDGGKTFTRWLDLLGGKSINGKTILFANPDSVPYHIHYQVLNAKHYGVPQNRERVFIVGIRDDEDNSFRFPAKVPLLKRLRDVLESKVDEKYYLSDTALEYLRRAKEDRNNENVHYDDGSGISSTLTANYHKGVHNCGETYIHYGNSQDQKLSHLDGVSQTLNAGHFNQPKIQIEPITKNSFEHNNHVVDTIIEHRGHLNKPAKHIHTGIVPTLRAESHGHESKVISQQRIRRLTPLECFRLMDFLKTFKWDVSDTQAYKQAGNSICVGVLAGIINNLNLNQ